MCDMQKMPSRDDASCDEDPDMNFATLSAVGGGTHFVTASGQVAKIQQGIAGNGSTLQQVVGMVGGMGESVQYVRTLESGATLSTTPQLISVPIALPGAKPGDPQPTVQIQVLGPNMMQTQQQPKYQMQIPIQGFQQGGAVLTLAYTADNETGSFQILGNALPEGVQVLAMPQEMQLMQPAQAHTQDKDQQHHQNIQHQVFITPNQQIVINTTDDNKLNNNTNNNNNNMPITDIIIKEECDETMNEDESSQGTESEMTWQGTSSSHQDLIKYLNTLPPQQTQALPPSLQQFLRMNPSDTKMQVEIDMSPETEPEAGAGDRKDVITEAVLGEDGTLRIQTKKKKKYKKKPSKPARPKPGQVVIAQSSDGTPIYCCPECQMAYPEKEQLEMHLIVHKIERRFICGICGAGLKRKEHLERHKLGHNPERPYVCGVCRKGFKRREHLNLHTVIHSGVKTELCGECGKGFYRKDHLRKHTRSHESKRARDEAQGLTGEVEMKPQPPPPLPITPAAANNNTILPEITIHVPTSANMQVPVQINIPQHVVSSLAAAQAAQAQAQAQAQADSDAHTQLDALLAQHT